MAGWPSAPNRRPTAPRELGGETWVVKGPGPCRGPRCGGRRVKLCRSIQEVTDTASALLGRQLVTKQTDANGKSVSRLPPLDRTGQRHRAGALPRLRPRPQNRTHHDRRLRPWRDRDRGSGRIRPRHPAPHDHRPRRGPRRIPGPRTGLLPRPQGRADRPDGEHPQGLLPRAIATSTP